MRSHKKIISATVLSIAFFTVASAQKPNPSATFEIKLAPENDSWQIQGNMRVLNRTGKPVAIYQSTYHVIQAILKHKPVNTLPTTKHYWSIRFRYTKPPASCYKK
jgi:hypothetical protein